MPNPKRERQKALRRAKLAKLQATKKRRRRLRRGAVVAAIAVVTLGLLYVFTRQTSPTHASAAAPCPAPNGTAPRQTAFTQQPPTCTAAHTAYSATVTTDVGTFTIGLARGNPKVVNSFVYLARYHYYRDLTFDRVIPGFVVQGGDLHPPTRANPNPTGPQGPGYTVRGAVPKAGTYQVGTVAMAKTGSAPAGTAGAQFFVIVGSQGTSLPPDYTVLGHVTSGMKVVDRIAADGGPQPHGYPKVVHKMRSVTISPG